jgi:hypothetical protein
MIKKTIILFIVLLVLLSGCRPTTSFSEDNAISAAVASTLAALPQPTAQPTYTPYPTFTPDAPVLEDLFCEYEFCIGHPPETAFFDANPSENPSVYSAGIIAAYRLPDFYSQLIWQPNNNSDDAQFMIDIILVDEVDTRRGNLDVNLLGDLTTFYSPIQNTVSEVIPTGGVAAWTCGDRAFALKIYAPTEEIAQHIFDEAMSKFRCNP